jgi:hypothetical protein
MCFPSIITDNALLEMAHLRNLEPPGPEHVKRLRRELDKLVSQSLLPEDATMCWEEANDDDFVVLRSGVDNGGRLNTWIRLGIEIFKWELWGRHKACFFACLRFLSTYSCSYLSMSY